MIYAVDDDPSAIGLVSAELERRYGRDYRVMFSTSPREALDQLAALHAADVPVALVLADQWMPEVTGTDVLVQVQTLYPRVKRGLLVSWGDWADEPTADAMREGMALGSFDYYVLKPWKSPDELFHRTICEFLNEWWREATDAPHEVTVIADPAARRSHEIRNLLARNGVPHVFHATDSETGSSMLREAGHEGATEPVVVMLGGNVLVNPSNVEVARGYGVPTTIGSVVPSRPTRCRTARPASEPLGWYTCGTPLRASRFRISCERGDPASATSVTSCGASAPSRHHSLRNSQTVRWNSSSGDFHGLRT